MINWYIFERPRVEKVNSFEKKLENFPYICYGNIFQGFFFWVGFEDVIQRSLDGLFFLGIIVDEIEVFQGKLILQYFSEKHCHLRKVLDGVTELAFEKILDISTSKK